MDPRLRVVVTAALGAVALLCNGVASGRDIQCNTGCAAGVNYTTQQNVLYVATCGGGTGSPAWDFGLDLAITPTNGLCQHSAGTCQGACSFTITVTYIESQTCTPTVLYLSGSECGTAIPPGYNTNGQYCGGFGSCVIYSTTLSRECGSENCTVRYFLSDTGPNPDENIGVAAVLSCATCPQP